MRIEVINLFCDALKCLRNKKDLTQEQLAKILGIAKSTISMYESGNRTPDFETVELIADYFNVSIDYLIGRKNLVGPKITTETVIFPVIGEIAAGYEHIAVEDWSGETVEVPVSYLKGRKQEDFFVLSVCGNSMYPQFQDGDKVLILKQQVFENGSIAAVIYDGECATLKKIEKTKIGISLIPVNPEYMPKEISGSELESFYVLGIPKYLIREI